MFTNNDDANTNRNREKRNCQDARLLYDTQTCRVNCITNYWYLNVLYTYTRYVMSDLSEAISS